MLGNYFKVAFRVFTKAKGYTLLNIIGLTTALVCVCLIAAWSAYELSYDQFFSKHERIYRVASSVQTGDNISRQAVTAFPLANALEKDFPEIEQVARLDINDCIVRYQDRQFEEDGVLFVDPAFANIFDVNMLDGSLGSALQEPYHVVITESIARKYFPSADDPKGYRNPAGETLIMFVYDPDSQGASYAVRGVVPDPPANSHFSYSILGSFSTIEAVLPEARRNWLNDRIYTYALLEENASAETLADKLDAFPERRFGAEMREQNRQYQFALQPLTDIHLYSQLEDEVQANGDINTIIVFMTIGLFILLIAAINYINLTTAWSLERAKEVGVKKVLGVPRRQIVIQFLLEASLIAFLAFGCAVLLAEWLRPAFQEWAGVTLETMLSFRLLAPLLFLTVLIGCLSGIYPALFISGMQSAQILKGRFRTSPTGILVRKSLIIAQFSITIVLLVGIGVVNSQMGFMSNKDLGFKQEGLLVLKVNGYAEIKDNYQAFKDDLLTNLPSVTAVAGSRGTITGGLGDDPAQTVDALGKTVMLNLDRQRVDADFRKTYDIDLLHGRDFVETDSIGGYMINEAAAHLLGWEPVSESIGKPFESENGAGEIVGVVRDFHYDGLHSAIGPVMLYLTPPSTFSRISLRLESVDILAAMNQIEATWRRHFPTALFQYEFMNERLAGQYRSDLFFANIFLAFVAISLLIASLGLLGLASFMIRQKTREIGIRKVLGASVTNIVSVISSGFMRLVLLANVIAWPIAALIMNNWLENFAYRIDLSWQAFVLAGALAFSVAMVTVGVQAIRASLVNPIHALKQD